MLTEEQDALGGMVAYLNQVNTFGRHIVGFPLYSLLGNNHTALDVEYMQHLSIHTTYGDAVAVGDNLILEARIHYAQRCADDVGEIPLGVGALILGDRLGWHGQRQILWHPVKSIGVSNCIREKQYQSTLPFLSN